MAQNKTRWKTVVSGLSTTKVQQAQTSKQGEHDFFTVIHSGLFYFALTLFLCVPIGFSGMIVLTIWTFIQSLKLFTYRSMAIYLTTPSSIFQLYRCDQFERRCTWKKASTFRKWAKRNNKQLYRVNPDLHIFRLPLWILQTLLTAKLHQ